MSIRPQVVLFGSIAGGWREQFIIPVLDEFGVSYYNPVQPNGWTEDAGEVEADVMASCETVVMVFNRTSPSFTALAETGWAALGCLLRNQHFILQIDLDYAFSLDPTLVTSSAGQDLNRMLQHWAVSGRYLVYKHAREFDHPRFHVVPDLPAVALKLREIYGAAK